MSFADEVRANPPRAKREWIREQLGDEAEEFEVALRDPRVEVRAIWRALQRRGITVSDRTVSGWAREERTRDLP